MIKGPSDWIKYSGAGMQMFITIMIFWWIGLRVEPVITSISSPWGQLIGVFLGIFVGMYNLIKSVQN